jgi:Spy/CpxP family protein refolding chaperone
MKSLLLPLLPLVAGAPQGMHPMGSPILRHAKELNLSDAQISQLKALAEARRESLHSAHEALMEAMRGLHASQNFDAAFDKAQTALQNLRPLLKKAMAEDLAVLTPDQQTAFKAMKPMGPRGPHGGKGLHPAAE